MFFPPFKQVVDRTAIDAVMASYNEIDGIPSHANTLAAARRAARGMGISRRGRVRLLRDRGTGHRATRSPRMYAAAATLALDAGVDVDFPDGAAYRRLVQCAGSGPHHDSRRSTGRSRRILTMKFNAGLFENPFVTDMVPALASNTARGGRAGAARCGKVARPAEERRRAAARPSAKEPIARRSR